ncbi:hypothetical protein ACFLZ2_01885 [Candidatus Margulisiibacteriota bacterium]
MSDIGSTSSAGAGYPKYLKSLYRALNLRDKDGDGVIEDGRVWSSKAGGYISHKDNENYQLSMDMNKDGKIDVAEAKYYVQTRTHALFGAFDRQNSFEADVRKKFELNWSDYTMLEHDLALLLKISRIHGNVTISTKNDIWYVFDKALEMNLDTSKLLPEAIKLIRSTDYYITTLTCIEKLVEAFAKDKSMEPGDKEAYYRDILVLARNIMASSDEHHYRHEANAVLATVKSMIESGTSQSSILRAFKIGLNAVYRIDVDHSKNRAIGEYKQLMRSYGFSNEDIDHICNKIDEALPY